MDLSNENKGSERLLKGSIVYFIGMFVSKGLSFLVLPLITIKLTTEQFGQFDLIQSIIILGVPILTLQSIEAVFKFLFNSEKSEFKKILSNLWVIIIVGSAIGLVILHIANLFINIPYLYFFFLFYLSTVLLMMYQRIARSLGLSLQFAISGILNSILLILVLLIALLLFTPSTLGLLVSYITASFFTIVYLEIKTHALRTISLKEIDRKTIFDLIKFGLPLVPSNISWYSVSLISKIVIVSYLGISANGIYAVGLKFTAILSALTDVFRLAWQESAIVSYEQENRTKFYSDVFDNYIKVIGYIIFIFVLLIKLVYPYIIGSDFIESANYVPIQILAVAISSIVGFYGVGYIASGETKDAFFTTLIGAIINITLLFLLIKNLGLFAPAISSVLAYLIIWILRHFRMKSIFEIRINKITLFRILFFGIVVFYSYYFVTNLIVFILLILVITLAIIDNYSFMKNLFISIKKIIIRK